MKYWIMFLIGVLLTAFICVNLFDRTHIHLETMIGIKYCVGSRHMAEMIYGQRASDILYHIYKFFQVSWFDFVNIGA